jgi:hypothetical protein
MTRVARSAIAPFDKLRRATAVAPELIEGCNRESPHGQAKTGMAGRASIGDALL